MHEKEKENNFRIMLEYDSNLNSCICGIFHCLQQIIVSRIKSHRKCTVHYPTYVTYTNEYTLLQTISNYFYQL